MEIARIKVIVFLNLLQVLYASGLIGFLHVSNDLKFEGFLGDLFVVFLILYSAVTSQFLLKFIKDYAKANRVFIILLVTGSLMGIMLAGARFDYNIVNHMTDILVVGFFIGILGITPVLAYMCLVPEQLRMAWAYVVGEIAYVVKEGDKWYIRDRKGNYASTLNLIKSDFGTYLFGLKSMTYASQTKVFLIEMLERNGIYYCVLK